MAAPVNQVAPTIVGDAIVGARLIYSPGVYVPGAGGDAPTVTYRWFTTGGTLLDSNIPYHVVELRELGDTIYVREYAEHVPPSGEVQVVSNELGPVVSVGDWLTPGEVAGYLDIPGDPDADERLVGATAAVKAAVERRRSDLDFLEPVADDIHVGSIRWAGLIYQSRGAPAGFTGFDEQSTVYDALGSQRAEIMRLIGWRRPVTA